MFVVVGCVGCRTTPRQDKYAQQSITFANKRCEPLTMRHPFKALKGNEHRSSATMYTTKKPRRPSPSHRHRLGCFLLTAAAVASFCSGTVMRTPGIQRGREDRFLGLRGVLHQQVRVRGGHGRLVFPPRRLCDGGALHRKLRVGDDDEIRGFAVLLRTSGGASPLSRCSIVYHTNNKKTTRFTSRNPTYMHTKPGNNTNHRVLLCIMPIVYQVVNRPSKELG